MSTIDQESAPSLGEVWPQVSRRLRAYLRTRHLSPADADDIAQSVAERVLKHDVAFDDADQLLHWCLTVARNLDVDRHRTLSRRGEAVLDEVAEHGDLTSLEDRVVTRLRLRSTLEALRCMRQPDRDAITRSLNPTEPASGRERVALHRARMRLLELVGPPAVIIGCGRRFLRSFTQPAMLSTTLAAAFFVSGLVGEAGVRVVVPPAMDRAVTSAPVIDSAEAPDRRSNRTAVRSSNPLHARAPKSFPVPSRTVLAVPGGAAALTGHDRRPQDDGLLCLRDLPVPTECVGPTSVPRPIR